MKILITLLFIIILTIFLGITLIIFMKKLKISKSIIKESLLILILCIFGEILAGIILSDIEKFLNLLPGVLILVPIVSGTRGSLMGIFCSRLTSALHLGSIEANFKKAFFLKDNNFKENVFGVLFLTILIAILSGAMAHYLCILFKFPSAGLFKFIFIVLIASFLSDFTLIITGTIISFFSFRKGFDPDNLLFPLNTTISDIISILFLVLSVRILV
ncbi:MAG: magnesium transporter [Candidatus Pacearchaeota archaeon]